MSESKYNILTFVEESVKANIRTLYKNNKTLTDLDIENSLSLILEQFTKSAFLLSYRINIKSILFEGLSYPNNIAIDVWTKFDNLEGKPLTLNFSLDYKL